jgi:hypothetical protein
MTTGQSTHLGGDHKDSYVRVVVVVERPGSKAAYAHSLHCGVPVAEQRRWRVGDIRSAAVEPATSGVGCARVKVRDHGESGKNNLADVAAPTRMHMKVSDDASDMHGRRHRSRASGLKMTLQRRHAKSVEAHRCRPVCQNGRDVHRATTRPRTEASHTGSCHSNPACATEFEAG